VFPYGCNCCGTVLHCRKLISYPGIVQAAGGSFKKTNTVPSKVTFAPPRPHDCRKTVATLPFFLFPLKHNRRDSKQYADGLFWFVIRISQIITYSYYITLINFL
jgi:hypothetical protein